MLPLRKAKLDPIRVENPAYPGTPDINYLHGWIEVKVVKKWPKDETAVVLVPHFTPQQRVWLRRRTEAGGEAYMLLKIGQSWLLFDGKTAAEIVGRAPRNQLLSSAIQHWERGLNGKELVKCLTS